MVDMRYAISMFAAARIEEGQLVFGVVVGDTWVAYPVSIEPIPPERLNTFRVRVRVAANKMCERRDG